MRIVLDTVVLVRALLNPFGRSGTLLFERMATNEWVVSQEVVERPELAKRFRTAAGRDVNAILDRIATATLVQPTHGPAVCRDPADDKFLASAIAGNARFILSEDNDLLDLGSYEGVQIVTAEAFLGMFGAMR